jgi:surface protein
MSQYNNLFDYTAANDDGSFGAHTSDWRVGNNVTSPDGWDKVYKVFVHVEGDDGTLLEEQVYPLKQASASVPGIPLFEGDFHVINTTGNHPVVLPCDYSDNAKGNLMYVGWDEGEGTPLADIWAWNQDGSDPLDLSVLNDGTPRTFVAVFNWDNTAKNDLSWIANVQQFGMSYELDPTWKFDENITDPELLPEPFNFRHESSLKAAQYAFLNIEGDLDALKYLDFADMTNASYLFADSKLDPKELYWNLENVTDMSFMFYNATNFNSASITGWNTENVTNMESMFEGASGYDGNLSTIENWKVTKVSNMNNMFKGATSFNQDISIWDVELIDSKPDGFDEGCLATWVGFGSADKEGQVGEDWGRPLWSRFSITIDDVHYTEDDLHMFITTGAGGTATLPTDNVIYLEIDGSQVAAATTITNNAEHDVRAIFDWDNTSKVSLDYIKSLQVIGSCTPIEGAVSNTGSGRVMHSIVTGKNAFYQLPSGSHNGIAALETEFLTNFESIFEGSGFNQGVSHWETANVETFHRAFADTTHFNQDVSTWALKEKTIVTEMFAGSQAFIKPLSNLQINKTDSIEGMFKDSNYDGKLDWNLKGVNVIKNVFSGATAFNQDINNWDVSTVTDMYGAFNGATAFSTSIHEWCVPEIDSKPTNFDTGSGIEDNEDLLPKWGTCPRAENLSFPIVIDGIEYQYENCHVLITRILGEDEEIGTDIKLPASEKAKFIIVDSEEYLTEDAYDQLVGLDLSVPHTITAVFDWDNSQEQNSLYWIEDITQFGLTDGKRTLANGEYAFYEFAGFQISALDSLDMSNLTSTAHMFQEANIDQRIGSLQQNFATTQVQDMSYMFYRMSNFNSPVYLDTTNVHNMEGMFEGSEKFNQDISSFNTTFVENIVGMFKNAAEFNNGGEPLNINVGSITDFTEMFRGTEKFQQNIENWDVSNAEKMTGMFAESNFDQELAKWNTVNVSNMDEMFKDSAFNKDISEWCVSLIDTEPTDFSTSLDEANKPQWSECPRGEDRYPVVDGDGNQYEFEDVTVFQTLPGVQVTLPVLRNDPIHVVYYYHNGENVEEYEYIRGVSADALDIPKLPDGESAKVEVIFEWATPDEVTLDWVMDVEKFGSRQRIDETNAYLYGDPLITAEIVMQPEGSSFISREDKVIEIVRAEAAPIDVERDVAVEERSSFTDIRGKTTKSGRVRAQVFPYRAFAGISSTTISAFNSFDYTWVTNKSAFLAECSLNEPRVSQWDGTWFTSIDRFFYNNKQFNQKVNWNTSRVTSAKQTFYGNTNSNEIDWDLPVLVSADEMFANGQFKSVTLNAPSLENAKGIFKNSGTYANAKIDLSSASKVNSWEEAFSGFSGETVSINTKSAQNLNATFLNATCRPNLPEFNVENVTTMIETFAGMTGAANTFEDISTWNVTKVRNLQGTFSNLGSRHNLVIDLSMWNTAAVTNMESTFANTIADVKAYFWDTSSVLSMNSMFENNTGMNSNLSGWCVPTTTHVDFDKGTSSAWTRSEKPNWGTCPRQENLWPIEGTDGKTYYKRDAHWITTSGNGKGIQFPCENGIPLVLVVNGEIKDPLTYNFDTNDAYDIRAVFDWDNTLFGDTPTDLGFIEDVKYFGLNSKTQQILQITSGENAFHNMSVKTFSGFEILDTSNLQSFKLMFSNANRFDGDISNWDTSNVTNMNGTFFHADDFNQHLRSWDVSQVTTMEDMFKYAGKFNKPLKNWNVSKVRNMIQMFERTTAFEQDISSWCVTNIRSKPSGFDRGSLLASYSERQPGWGLCPNVVDPFPIIIDGIKHWDEDASILEIDTRKINASAFFKTGALLVLPFGSDAEIKWVDWGDGNNPETYPELNLTHSSGNKAYGKQVSANKTYSLMVIGDFIGSNIYKHRTGIEIDPKEIDYAKDIAKGVVGIDQIGTSSVYTLAEYDMPYYNSIDIEQYLPKSESGRYEDIVPAVEGQFAYWSNCNFSPDFFKAPPFDQDNINIPSPICVRGWFAETSVDTGWYQFITDWSKPLYVDLMYETRNEWKDYMALLPTPPPDNKNQFDVWYSNNWLNEGANDIVSYFWEYGFGGDLRSEFTPIYSDEVLKFIPSPVGAQSIKRISPTPVVKFVGTDTFKVVSAETGENFDDDTRFAVVVGNNVVSDNHTLNTNFTQGVSDFKVYSYYPGFLSIAENKSTPVSLQTIKKDCQVGTHKCNCQTCCGSCNCSESCASCGCGCGGGDCGCSWGQCGCPGDMFWYNKQSSCGTCCGECNCQQCPTYGECDIPADYTKAHNQWVKIDNPNGQAPTRAEVVQTSPEPYVLPKGIKLSDEDSIFVSLNGATRPLPKTHPRNQLTLLFVQEYQEYTFFDEVRGHESVAWITEPLDEETMTAERKKFKKFRAVKLGKDDQPIWKHDFGFDDIIVSFYDQAGDLVDMTSLYESGADQSEVGMWMEVDDDVKIRLRKRPDAFKVVLEFVKMEEVFAIAERNVENTNIEISL